MSAASRRQLFDFSMRAVRDRFVKFSSLNLPPLSSEESLVRERSTKLFDYTVPGGKNARSMLALSAFDSLKPHADSQLRRCMAESAVTIEMTQSFYLILDDIMDGAETRRGKTCWYKRPDVGMAAINDGLLLDVFINDVLDDALHGHPNLEAVQNAFRQTKRKTTIGQLLDMGSVRDVNNFSWERYEHLVAHKTSHYTYCLPLLLAMLVADMRVHIQRVESIAYRIGFLFQSQDDVLDVFGDSEVTGKIGTDIQDGKCTWVTVRAKQLMNGNPNLMKEFTENFGSTDQNKVDVVRNIFEQLELRKEFSQFEKKFSGAILQDIETFPLVELQPVLLEAVHSILGRKL